MKHGILSQHLIQTADTPELAYTFAGSAAFNVSFVNHDNDFAEFAVAHVPAGETLSLKHWFITKQDIQNWDRPLMRWLAKAGDEIHVRCSESGGVVHLNGVET